MLAVLKQLGNEGIQVVAPVAMKHQKQFNIDEELLKNLFGTSA